MAFGNWVRNTNQKAQRFFNKSVGHVRTGVAFLNNTVLPGARSAHRTISNVSTALQGDSNVSVKNKERLQNISRLSDIGLQKLSSGVETVNRVKAAV